MPPEPFGAHFLVGSFDVFTISEFDRVAAEHFPRQYPRIASELGLT